MEDLNQSEKQPPYAGRESNAKHGIPALISFFLPGVGQIIKGHILKALFIWALQIIGVIMAACGIVDGAYWNKPYLIIITILAVVGLLILYVWNIYDAYNSN